MLRSTGGSPTALTTAESVNWSFLRRRHTGGLEPLSVTFICMASRRVRASTGARGRALRAYARQSDFPEDLAEQVVAAVTSVRNPVLRLRVIDALEATNEPLRAVKQMTVRELRSEDWSWREIGLEIETTPERACQIGNGR